MTKIEKTPIPAQNIECSMPAQKASQPVTFDRT